MCMCIQVVMCYLLFSFFFPSFFPFFNFLFREEHMSFQSFARVLLWAVLAASQDTAFIDQQQSILYQIAEQIRKAGAYPSCSAPYLASCGTSACSGSGCGTFSIGFTPAKKITSLFVFKSFSLIFQKWIICKHE